MADKPPEGFGRGGRGAALLAALKSQPPRRPGETTADTTPEVEQKPVGRGAQLRSVLALSRGRAIPAQQEESELPKFGRGRAIPGAGRGLPATDVISSERKSPDSPVSPSSSASSTLTSIGRGSPITTPTPIARKEPTESKPSPSPPSPSSLSSDFEELTIGKYKGTSGIPIELEVNYVRLKIMGNEGIYEYHVSFSPSVDSKRMKFRLVSQQAVRDVIGNVKTFDGSKLYLPRKLQATTEIYSSLPTDNSQVLITIKYIKVCRPSDLLHLYNLLFRKVMHILKMTQVGRNYFDPKGSVPVPQHKLEVWPGYVTAVQEYEGGVMLNCDASFRVLRTVTARDVMHDATKQGRNARETVAKALIGSVVLTKYNNKTYRVDDIAWDMNPNSSFTTHDQSEITFMEYYRKAYDLQIQDVNQPLLINKAKKKIGQNESEQEKLICLIPEFCFMTGLTDEMRADFKVMKDIASCTRVNPERRQLALKKFMENINTFPEAKECFTNWNLQLDLRPLSLEGRTLASETLFFGRDVKIQVNPEADWGRQATGNHVLVPVHFEKWVLVFTKRDAPRALEFAKMLKNVSPSMGIQVKEPIRIEIHNDRTETYCEALKEAINPTVQIVVIIFPTARDDRYSAVKKLCCVDMPVPSQVINSKTISQPQKLRSIVQKIALQMNCKLGGELWSVNIPIQNLMICGMDTYHDASRSKKSVLAFVASMNQNRTRWFSMTAMQKPGQEAGDCLKMLFIASIRKYFEVNHRLPEKVVLFRDGVGDGQIDFISKYEVEQLTSCYKHFSPDYSPALSVVVVQKRINTRMYAVQKDRGRSVLANPPPGSVLDHSVTRKRWYDYFLVSQHVRQGTVSPTHYVVIYDTSSLKPEHMQKMTYKMTHMYYNWPGTVRVPAPCQYAHKLAYLVGQNLHRETHCDLSDRLFYL